jgi:hypothetical protein
MAAGGSAGFQRNRVTTARTDDVTEIPGSMAGVAEQRTVRATARDPNHKICALAAAQRQETKQRPTRRSGALVRGRPDSGL